MPRLLLALISFSLAAIVALPVPAGAVVDNPNVTFGAITPTTLEVSWTTTVTATYEATIAANDGGAIGGGTVAAGAPDTTTTTTFTGLTPGASYTVTVTGTDGDGPVSDTATGSTADAAPSGASIGIDSQTSTSITASWSAVGVGVTYEATIAANGGGSVGTDSVGPGSSATSGTFTGLDPAESYTVTVVATNVSGSDSDTATGSTADAAPSGASIGIDSQTSTSITASWSAAPAGVTYEATIAANGGGSVGTDSVGPGSSATSGTFTGLDPAESYTVTVVATNVSGSDSDTATGSTAFGSSGAPTAVVASLSGVNDTDVTVAWQAPTNTGGGLGNYTVRLFNGNTQVATETAGPTATSVAFTDLPAGTTFTATVQSSNGGGASGGTSVESNSVRTSNVPDQVTGLSAAWAGESNINAIEVSWTAPASTGGLDLTGFVVDVTPALDGPIPVVDPDQDSLTIGGLEQGTSYTVTVRAQNDRGNSAGTSSGSVLVPSTPGTVTDLAVEQSPPFSNSIVLTWDLPEEDGGSAITGFSIVVDDRDPLVVGPDVVTASFSDLPVGDHNVTVRAITAAGLGATVTSPNFEVKAFAPFDSEEAFVTQLYADFLLRTPDAGGLAFWTERVANDGSNVQDIVEAFMRSPEFAPRRAVARLYFAYFNRQPDKGGFDFWTRQISSGAANLENASQSFALSQEFAVTYGDLSDAEFIVLVYNNVLGRRPDQGGFEFWLQMITDGMPRGSMMTSFSESPENIELSRPAVDVTVTYDGLLQRAPDVEGFTFWTNLVNEGDTGLTQLIRQFYFSLEYADRVNR